MAGTAVNTGLQVAKNAEELKLAQNETIARERQNDEFYRQLREKATSLKMGRGVKENSKTVV